jgi:hypothetical protein
MSLDDKFKDSFGNPIAATFDAGAINYKEVTPDVSQLRVQFSIQILNALISRTNFRVEEYERGAYVKNAVQWADALIEALEKK